MSELWVLLLSAQESPLRVPALFIEQKKEELRKRQQEDSETQALIKQRQDLEAEKERKLAEIRQREHGISGRGRTGRARYDQHDEMSRGAMRSSGDGNYRNSGFIPPRDRDAGWGARENGQWSDRAARTQAGPNGPEPERPDSLRRDKSRSSRRDRSRSPRRHPLRSTRRERSRSPAPRRSRSPVYSRHSKDTRMRRRVGRSLSRTPSRSPPTTSSRRQPHGSSYSTSRRRQTPSPKACGRDSSPFASNRNRDPHSRNTNGPLSPPHDRRRRSSSRSDLRPYPGDSVFKHRQGQTLESRDPSRTRRFRDRGRGRDSSPLLSPGRKSSRDVDPEDNLRGSDRIRKSAMTSRKSKALSISASPTSEVSDVPRRHTSARVSKMDATSLASKVSPLPSPRIDRQASPSAINPTTSCKTQAQPISQKAVISIRGRASKVERVSESNDHAASDAPSTLH